VTELPDPINNKKYKQEKSKIIFPQQLLPTSPFDYGYSPALAGAPGNLFIAQALQIKQGDHLAANIGY
jgi:hypothetical protein